MENYLKDRYEKLLPLLDERSRRLVAAADCATLGVGAYSKVARASGLSRPTLYKGVREMEECKSPSDRIRKPGGGRKSADKKYPQLESILEELVSDSTRGDPMQALRWTTKSTRKLAQALASKGIAVSHRVVAATLSKLNYSLQANSKCIEEGSDHPDRNAQFEHINKEVSRCQMEGQPVISVDTKKKELVGNYKNGGKQWRPQQSPIQVKVHDFIDQQLGKAIPYGIYDVGQNMGWVNVGCDHDTGTFAVESIRRWWRDMGQGIYPQAKRLLICADGGGSNGHRVRLWKKELQGLADETGMELQVCHLPPGTSKWNRIEHRLFSHISINWRGKPLTSHEVIVQLISATTTKTGLRVKAQRDAGKYPDKIKVSDHEMANLNLERAEFHGDWNYSLKPRTTHLNM